MFSKGLTTASNNYLSMKAQLGERRPSVVNHIVERRPSIIQPEGTYHRSMMELQQNLGRAGTKAEEIENLMGSPSKILDRPDETLSYELKRNNEKYQYPHNAKIWIYQWRGNHDYVYFIISNDNKVIQSAWYYAFE